MTSIGMYYIKLIVKIMAKQAVLFNRTFIPHYKCM